MPGQSAWLTLTPNHLVLSHDIERWGSSASATQLV